MREIQKFETTNKKPCPKYSLFRLFLIFTAVSETEMHLLKHIVFLFSKV